MKRLFGGLPAVALGMAALALGAGTRAAGQERTGAVRLSVVPERADWSYAVGAPARFRVALVRDGHSLAGTPVKVACGPEMMPPSSDRSVTAGAEALVVDGGTMKEPGFLRCAATATVDGREYRAVGTAAYAPERILPAVENPADFDAFWTEAKEALAKLPIDARLTPKPELSTGKVDVFHVSLQNVGSDAKGASRFYGILAVPKAEGRFPALMNPPGAGARPYRGLVDVAERGYITLQVGIHGIPLDLPPEVYDSLLAGAFNTGRGYAAFNLDDRDRYYYRRVYLGCLRANDFLVSHPKWDGKSLIVTGGSQGGALTITTAGLDPRVTAIAPYYPALSDMAGYLKGRAGGWPHIFREEKEGHRTPAKLRTASYYDVVNFARRVKAPGLYAWGWNDEVCPPTSMHAVYHVVTAPKELLLAVETGHNTVPEET
ncbi:MAG TPA: acetylxylan esterase, partial [Vicinamibacteria bacterium]